MVISVIMEGDSVLVLITERVASIVFVISFSCMVLTTG